MNLKGKGRLPLSLANNYAVVYGCAGSIIQEVSVSLAIAMLCVYLHRVHVVTDHLSQEFMELALTPVMVCEHLIHCFWLTLMHTNNFQEGKASICMYDANI